MTLPPRLRKVVLTTHVATSVGWLGAVAAYLALDITATATRQSQTARAAYVAMDVIVTDVIVPLAIAAVIIGILNALGTPWGLFRHYWVIIKLLLTLFATTIVLLESQTVAALAETAASAADPRDLPGTQLHSIGGMLVLLTTLVLSVYKPRGVTRYGRRNAHAKRQ